jgi:dolichol kinase
MATHTFYSIFYLVSFFGIHILCGVLVKRWSWKVNFTRKITHFSIFLLNIVGRKLFPFETTASTFWILSAVSCGFYFIFFECIRKRVPLIQLAFMGVDRPEDQPYTLFWLLTQIFLLFAAIYFLQELYLYLNMKSFIFIPFFIVFLGDGLAEPIGIRFGKHFYSVPSLAGRKTYFRSLEGSLWVFICTCAIVFYYLGEFASAEKPYILLGLPLIATITEGLSPHTIDAPFLYLNCGVYIAAICYFV